MRRHDWVYLQPGASVTPGSCAPPVHAWIEDWVARGGPLVATRQDVPPGRLALGAVTPTRLGRVRVACAADVAAVARVRGPIAIGEAARVLPRTVARALARLEDALAAHGARVGVYGSTAWSFVTGDEYRRAGSDVDVVCDVDANAALDACLAALDVADRTLSGRLDGEIRFACGRAVAWRELAAAVRDGLPLVLAKGPRALGMASLRDLVGSPS